MPVPVDPLADKVVRGSVAQVDREIGNRLVEVDEAIREGMTVVRGNRGGTGRHQRRSRNGNQYLLHRAVLSLRGTGPIPG